MGEIESKKEKLSIVSKANATVVKDLHKSSIFPSLERERTMWKGVACSITCH